MPLHEGTALSTSNCTPTNAAKDPVLAFSSEYHEKGSPFQESCSQRPRSAIQTRKSAEVSTAGSACTQLCARSSAQLRAANASVAPSATAKRAERASISIPIASSHSVSEWPLFGKRNCLV